MSTQTATSTAAAVPCKRSKASVALTIIAIVAIVILVIVVIVLAVLFARKIGRNGSGGICTSDTNCESGLNCVSGFCTCVQPDPPTGLNAKRNAGNLIVSWNASPGANYYNVRIIGPGTNITNNNYKSTTLTFPASSGIYTITVYAVSTKCGYDSNRFAQITTPVI